MDFQNPFNDNDDTQSQDRAPKNTVCRAVFKFLGLIGATLTFIRNVICNIAMILVCLLVFVGIEFVQNIDDLKQEVIKSNTPQAPIEKPSLIVFNLNGPISEMPFSNGEIDVLSRQLNKNITGNTSHSVENIVKSLNKAKDDNDIESCFFNLDDIGALSLAKAQRIADAIDDFKKGSSKSPKKVSTFATNYSQASYIIASHADAIYLDPLGSINFTGVGLNSLYFKDLLDRFKVTPYIFRAGEFKSAIESFSRNDMSDGVKAEYQKIADNLWQVYLDKLKKKSNIANTVQTIVSNPEQYISDIKEFDGNFAQMAKNKGLCTDISDMPHTLKTLASSSGFKNDSLYMPKYIDYDDYLQFYAQETPLDTSDNKLACIYGIGEITDNAQDTSSFSPKNLVPILDKIAIDKSIKGVLFHINSGGGSVKASEDILRALNRVKEAGKKIVVSFNGTGASGAYWISTAADAIFATDDTITGSIGVFGMSFGFDKLLNEYGVYQDGVVTSEFAQRDIAKPMSSLQMQVNTLSVESIYKRFINIVCASRKNLNKSDYKTFAEGKVFNAKEALKIGLIDKIGGHNDAYLALNKLTGGNDENPMPLVNMVPSKGQDLSFVQDLILKHLSSYMPDEITSALLKISLKKDLKVDEKPHLMAIMPLETKY